MDAADAMKTKAAKKNLKKQKMNKLAFKQKNTNSFFYFYSNNCQRKIYNKAEDLLSLMKEVGVFGFFHSRGRMADIYPKEALNKILDTLKGYKKGTSIALEVPNDFFYRVKYIEKYGPNNRQWIESN